MAHIRDLNAMEFPHSSLQVSRRRSILAGVESRYVVFRLFDVDMKDKINVSDKSLSAPACQLAPPDPTTPSSRSTLGVNAENRFLGVCCAVLGCRCENMKRMPRVRKSRK